MKRKLFIFLVFFLSLILVCNILIINGCAKNNTETITVESQETAFKQENSSTQSENESSANENGTESTEEPASITEETISEEEILTEANDIFKQEKKPSLLFTLLDKNSSGLSNENANKALENLQQLLKIYETKYTDRLLFEKNGIYQQQINDFVQGLPGGIVGELAKEQILNISDIELKNLLFEIFDNGYKLITTEGSWYPIIDYSRFNSYLDYLSDDYKAYFLFKTLESDKIFAKDAALIITWDELAQRVLAAEDFLIKYPQSSKYKEMGDNYYSYLMFYYIGMNNTPAFDYDTNKFKEDVLASYNKIISDSKNKGFFTVELINKYLDVIALNNNTINENVRSYIRNSYTQVENKYGIVNPYTGT